MRPRRLVPLLAALLLGASTLPVAADRVCSGVCAGDVQYRSTVVVVG